MDSVRSNNFSKHYQVSFALWIISLKNPASHKICLKIRLSCFLHSWYSDPNLLNTDPDPELENDRILNLNRFKNPYSLMFNERGLFFLISKHLFEGWIWLVYTFCACDFVQFCWLIKLVSKLSLRKFKFHFAWWWLKLVSQAGTSLYSFVQSAPELFRK